MRHLVLSLLAGLLIGDISGAVAEAPPTSASTIRVQGRSEAVVTESTIRLGDIAQIDSPNVQDDEAVIQLKKISVGASPKAGETAMLDGSKILERLQEQGVRLNVLRYSLPRQVSVTRAFREVKIDELERTLASFLVSSGRQFDVKQIVMDRPIRVPTDSYGLEVVALRTTQPGHIGVDYKSVAGSDEVRFQLRAVADEWRLMPVATRPLPKGVMITANDIQLQKVNGTSVGRDIVENIGDLIGRSVTKDIGQGEMFRAGAIVLPPVVTAGSRVTVIFREKRLEATASGVALESGAAGQDIRVRNEQSKRVITARVSEPGLVIVGAQ